MIENTQGNLQLDFFNCPTAANALNGGTFCMFNSFIDAYKYCDSSDDCAGINEVKNSNTFNITRKQVLNPVSNVLLNWYPKS